MTMPNCRELSFWASLTSLCALIAPTYESCELLPRNEYVYLLVVYLYYIEKWFFYPHSIVIACLPRELRMHLHWLRDVIYHIVISFLALYLHEGGVLLGHAHGRKYGPQMHRAWPKRVSSTKRVGYLSSTHAIIT